jgi:hypothetical protein
MALIIDLSSYPNKQTELELAEERQKIFSPHMQEISGCTKYSLGRGKIITAG